VQAKFAFSGVRFVVNSSALQSSEGLEPTLVGLLDVQIYTLESFISITRRLFAVKK